MKKKKIIAKLWITLNDQKKKSCETIREGDEINWRSSIKQKKDKRKKKNFFVDW